MYRIKIIGLLLVGLTVSLSNFLYAEEVTEVINEALEQYKNEDYAAAAGNLDYAAQLIRQKKGDQLKNFLPEPLAGWEAGEITSQAAGAAVFGGGVRAERKYRKDSGSVSIEIVADSPLLQSMTMLFNNPALIAGGGSKLERIQGQKAIVKYKADRRQGEIQIMVANRFLVSIRGKNVEAKDLKDYAASIDYQKIAGLA